MRNRASELLLEYLCRSPQKIGSLAGPCGDASQLVRGWRGQVGTPEIAKSRAHPERDALPPKRIPAEPQQDEQKDHQKPKRCIPTLMFHYRVLGCLWAVFAAGHVAICCRLFPVRADCRNCYR